MVWCPVSTTLLPCLKSSWRLRRLLVQQHHVMHQVALQLFFFSECNITQFAPTKQTGSHWRWRPWLCPCSVFVCRRSRETVEQLGSCLFWMLWFWFSIDRERPDATTVIDSSCILCFIVGAIVYSVGQTRRNRQPICWLRKVICSLILAALKFRSVITTESACSLWL